jgi:uncharacterized membrane protein (UPF0127 family)
MADAPRRPSWRRGAAGLLAVGLLVLGGAACSDTDSDAGGTDPSTTADPGGTLFGAGELGCVDEPDPMTVGGPPFAGTFTDATITVLSESGEDVESCVLVADTADERARGLMEVTDLGGYAGMLFVFEQPVDGAFHMRNTPTALSIAWFDAEGALVSTEDMEPCVGEVAEADECPSYPSNGAFAYAVEVPEGQLEAIGVDGPDAELSLAGEQID